MGGSDYLVTEGTARELAEAILAEVAKPAEQREAGHDDG
jgi:hypothetical protein